jgi:hypothetical protein
MKQLVAQQMHTLESVAGFKMREWLADDIEVLNQASGAVLTNGGIAQPIASAIARISSAS